MNSEPNFAAEAMRLKIKQLYDGFLSGGDFQLASELFSANLQLSDCSLRCGDGIQAAAGLLSAWRNGFPDMHYIVEAVLIEGAHAMSRFLFQGSHMGTFCGIGPTGRRVQMRGADFFTFEHGKIVEWSYVEDRLSLAAGLGLAAQGLCSPKWPFTEGTQVQESSHVGS